LIKHNLFIKLSKVFHTYAHVLKSLQTYLYKREENNSPFIKGGKGDFFKKLYLNPVCRIRYRIYETMY
jgi:hypothetical protein